LLSLVAVEGVLVMEPLVLLAQEDSELEQDYL
jgi:hypothetical protein